VYIKINKTNLVLSKEYTTHMMVLIRAVQMSTGPIVEIGGGLFSTPLLHWLCAEERRRLVTYEDNPDFAPFLKSFTSRSHTIHLIEDWHQIDLKTHWGLAFVDHDPINDLKNITKRRQEMVLQLKDKADYIVIHDSNDKGYGNGEFWNNFKYVYHWTWATPNTSIVSDIKEIFL